MSSATGSACSNSTRTSKSERSEGVSPSSLTPARMIPRSLLAGGFGVHPLEVDLRSLFADLLHLSDDAVAGSPNSSAAARMPRHADEAGRPGRHRLGGALSRIRTHLARRAGSPGSGAGRSG